MCPSFYALLIIALLANYCLSFSGTSSCYGDYQNILKSGSIVGAGIGNFISGEFFLLVHSSDANDHRRRLDLLNSVMFLLDEF